MSNVIIFPMQRRAQGEPRDVPAGGYSDNVVPMAPYLAVRDEERLMESVDEVASDERHSAYLDALMEMDHVSLLEEMCSYESACLRYGMNRERIERGIVLFREVADSAMTNELKEIAVGRLRRLDTELRKSRRHA